MDPPLETNGGHGITERNLPRKGRWTWWEKMEPSHSDNQRQRDKMKNYGETQRDKVCEKKIGGVYMCVNIRVACYFSKI